MIISHWKLNAVCKLMEKSGSLETRKYIESKQLKQHDVFWEMVAVM